MYAGNDYFLGAVVSRGVDVWRVAGRDEWVAEDGWCPVCGSRPAGERGDGNRPDRVRLYPVDAGDRKRRNGHWYCHHCESRGDGIDFLRRRFGLSFVDAYAAIHGTPPPDRHGWKSFPPGTEAGRPRAWAKDGTPAEGHPQGGAPTASVPGTFRAGREGELLPAPEAGGQTEARASAGWSIKANPLPCVQWMSKAMLLSMELNCTLHELPPRVLDEARHAIEEERGIRLELAAWCGVHWNPKDQFFLPAEWGLRRERKLFLPRGIVIAVMRNRRADCSGYVAGILVRRAEPGNGDKLRWLPCRDDDSALPRTRTLVLGQSGQPVLLVESALDAILLFQETRGSFAVVATCGAGYPLDEDAGALLREAPALWAWPDADEAGDKAFAKWQGAFPGLRRIAMPMGPDGMPAAKDPTDLARLNRTRPGLPTVGHVLREQGVLND